MDAGGMDTEVFRGLARGVGEEKDVNEKRCSLPVDSPSAGSCPRLTVALAREELRDGVGSVGVERFGLGQRPGELLVLAKEAVLLRVHG